MDHVSYTTLIKFLGLKFLQYFSGQSVTLYVII